MDTNAVKKSIVNSYGLLAKSKNTGLFSNLFACCNTTSQSNEIAENIGYSKEVLEQVPEHANLGVGCGNPTSLSTINQGEKES